MTTLSMFTAIGAFDRGDYTRAKTLFEDILTDDPANALAHARLSMCLFQMAQYFAAAEEADRALSADPELPLAHVARAWIAVVMDDNGTADAALAEALRLDPQNWNALEIRCARALRDNDAEGLRREAEALVQLRPNMSEAHALLSRAASLRRDGGLAERHAREALRLDPNDAFSHEAIGWAFWASKSYSKATDAGLSALAINPNSAGAQALLAVVDMEQQRLMGWFHRLGWIVNKLSMRTLMRTGALVLFAFMVANDVLRYANAEGLATALTYAFAGFFAAIWLSHMALQKKATANLKAARLKTSY